LKQTISLKIKDIGSVRQCNALYLSLLLSNHLLYLVNISEKIRDIKYALYNYMNSTCHSICLCMFIYDSILMLMDSSFDSKMKEKTIIYL